MFKQELPLMFPDEADVLAVKEAMWDPFEYLVARSKSMSERRMAEAPEPNSYRIDIRGSGPLIPPELLENIFEEYTTYGGGQDRSGGGLGLAICRMILSAHEGCVWAENTEEGPRFSFILPVRSSEPQEPEAAQPQLIHSELM
jgi:K+-sensing histidine kinase KdpD